MREYFLRRLLLVPITLFGLTLVVFLITRFAPGGPLETALKAATLGQSGEGSSSREGSGGIDDTAKEALANYYGYDQSAIRAYCVWLGVAPREHGADTPRGGVRAASPQGASASWCRGPESNRHALSGAADFKSAVSTNFTTSAKEGWSGLYLRG